MLVPRMSVHAESQFSGERLLMRGSGNLLRASASIRCSAGASLWSCLIATLLIGFASSAQDELPSGVTPSDATGESPSEAASESPADDAGAAQESSAETDEPGDDAVAAS